MKIRLFFILIVCITKIYGQEINYVRDSMITPALLDDLSKSSKEGSKNKTTSGLIQGATTEEDRLFFINKEGEPTTQKGKYLYFVEGPQKNGLRNGVFNFQAPDAKNVGKMTLVKEMTFENDVLNGPFTYFYPNGAVAQKGNYLSDKREGKVSEYYPNGKLFCELTFIKDVVEGSLKEYYQNGTVKLSMNSKHGKPDGPYLKFYQDGKPMEEWNYVNGAANGRYRYYHPNGQVWVEKEYKNNLLWNVVANYDESGKMMDKGTLKNGTGTVLSYDNGKVYLIEYFRDGKLIKEEKK